MHTAICAFDERARAEEAIAALVRSGFDRQDIHLQHRHAGGEGRIRDAGGSDATHDRGALSSFGHFFASLLGRDNPSGQVDTYSDHVERGGFVVVVDAHDDAQAQRARGLLQEQRGTDVQVMHRAGQAPMRDLVHGQGAVAGMVERSREPYESSTPASPIARERAMASDRLDAIGGPSLRSPELEHPPGLRYADKPTE